MKAHGSAIKWPIAVVLLLVSGIAFADCYCTCINGRNQPVCDNALEVPPVCGPRVCPVEPPSVPPVTAPRVPPVGTKICRPQLVWDHNYGKYVWKEICR